MAGKTLVTTFDDVHEAERAVQKLQQDGFAPERLGWIEHQRGHDIAHGNLIEHRNVSTVGRVFLGAILGALAGMLILVVAATLLDVERSFRIASGFVGLVVGACVGAVIGKRLDSIARTDVPGDRAHRLAERLAAGTARVAVTVSNEEEEARALEILRGEASLHRHRFSWRVADDERRSLA